MIVEFLQVVYGTTPTCIRCGMCCSRFGLLIPNLNNMNERIMKDEGVMCPFNSNGSCTIHNSKDYPDVCRDFHSMGESYICALGKAHMRISVRDSQQTDEQLVTLRNISSDERALIAFALNKSNNAVTLSIDNEIVAFLVYGSSINTNIDIVDHDYSKAFERWIYCVYVCPEWRGHNFAEVLIKNVLLLHKDHWPFHIECVNHYSATIATRIAAELQDALIITT